ncbi:MAG TPA: hypothetical protein VGL77_18770 [Armatimonadota bacterium]|jgi:uncharacterized metal-binding protein
MGDKRFAAVPIIATILRVLAVLMVLFFLYQSIEGVSAAIASWKGGMGQLQPYPPVTGFGARLASLAGPLFSLILGVLIASVAWGLAELFAMVRALALTEKTACTCE